LTIILSFLELSIPYKVAERLFTIDRIYNRNC